MINTINYPYKICDPIHGFIRIDEIEKRIIDSLAFQRLRYIRQMGVAFLVFPGATHTRFEHSLGVMELASRIYDAILSQRNIAASLPHIPDKASELRYYRRILRLAALCHDLGHLPFSHTAEKEILGKGGHERMTQKILQSDLLSSTLKELSCEGRDVESDVLKLTRGESSEFQLTPWEKILSQIIADDYFGADRIDYLLRDAAYTGVGYGHLDWPQLIDTLRILPRDGGELTMGVFESGLHSVESLLMARYLMYGRVYHHPKCRLYSQHLVRFMVRHYAKKGFPETVTDYLDDCDFSILVSLQQEAKAGDYDAKVLLKQADSFVELPLPSEIDQDVNRLAQKLQNTFKGDFFLDYVAGEARRGDILLLRENGEIDSASSHSFFLREHPSLSPKMRLFVFPKRSNEIFSFLKN